MNWIKKIFRREPKTERIELKLVRYCNADKMLAEGWQLAPEEDTNRELGWVYLEKRREINGESSRG